MDAKRKLIADAEVKVKALAKALAKIRTSDVRPGPLFWQMIEDLEAEINALWIVRMYDVYGEDR